MEVRIFCVNCKIAVEVDRLGFLAISVSKPKSLAVEHAVEVQDLFPC